VEITEVRVFPRGSEVPEENKLKAYASITFDGIFVVKGLKVIDGKDGLFVVMPGKKMADGTFKDTAHPINSGMRKTIESRVLDKFYETRILSDLRAQ
jgi:stage V sporulation protein G